MGEFKSFDDLRKARGGARGREPAEEADERGWTLEGPEVASLDEAGALAAADGSEGSRARIAARPSGFGPMTAGPACYRTTESEEMELLHSFRVRTVFPDDVLAEVRALPSDPRPSDFEGRLDLRGETIFTIDGEDAKDFDDAISIEERPDGSVAIGVHVADVGHYVHEGTRLDDEALARATSIYLPDQVVPMLPEELSNRLCSLVPRRPRLAHSVLMEFDEKGRRTSAEVRKSVIESRHRCTYRVVQALLDGEDTDEVAAIRELESPLRAFQRWTRLQQKIRDAKGSLRIQSREKKFLFDGDHEVERVVDSPRYFSMALIEETALAANQAVGDLFRSRGLPTLYRVHPEKDPEEIAAVAKMLEELGIRVPKKERLTGRDIGRMIRQARRRPNADAMIARIMGLVERALYQVRDHEDVARHFGLAREAYLHFTSPIRRYPDLVVHRWLWSVESRGAEAERELRAAELVDDLNEVAAHASLQAEVAEMTQRAVEDLKVCQYLHPHVGEKVEARVSRVSRYGLEVHLVPFNVQGFLPARVLGDRPKVAGATLTVRAGKRMLSFTEGYEVAVRIADVDFLRLEVLLELA